MAYDLGAVGAAVTLDTDEYNRKMAGLPQTAENSFRKVAELAAVYLSFRAVLSFVKTATMSFSALENAAWNFDQTFRAIPGTAAEVEQKMRTLYQLSEQTSKGMLSSVGDQLQAFGMGAEASLLKAKEIAERGIDLASYKGGNQADAVSDISRALTGETEGMKKWGVVIRQGSKEFENMVEKIQQTTGATFELARAEAIFEIILDQTANAKGDYLKEGANIAQTLTNIRQKTLEATSSMGAHLSGGVRPLLEGYDALLGKFNALDPSSQKILMQLAAMSAAMILLHTSTGKALNAKIALAAAKLSGGGEGVQAKAEAAAVVTAEKLKQAAYNTTAALRTIEFKKYELEIAKETVMESRLALARASVNVKILEGTGTIAQQTVAKKQLLIASQTLTKALAGEAAAAAGLTQAHQACNNAVAIHTGAANANAVANANVAKAATVSGRAQLFLAGGLRAAGNGLKALYAALGPIGWAIIAVTAAMSAWQFFAGRQQDKIKSLIDNTDKAAKKTDEDAAANDRARDAYKGKAERLKELAGYTDRNNAEQEEALQLAKELRDRYGDLGITVNELTGEIEIAAGAWDKMSEAEKRYAEIKMEDQIKKHGANIKASLQGALINAPGNIFTDIFTGKGYTADNKGYADLIGSLSRTADSVDLLPELALSEVEKQANEERKRGNIEYAKELEEIAEKIKNLIELNGKLSAVRRLGAEGVDVEKQKAKETEEQRKARERLAQARFDRDYGQSDAEAQAKMLDAEIDRRTKELKEKAGNKAESDYSKEELEIAKQIVDLERQREEIRKRSKDAFKDEAESYAQSAEQRKLENAQRQTDRELSKLESEHGSEAAMKRMESELQKAKKSADRLKAEYNKAIKDAQRNPDLTDEERKRIQRARQKLDEANAAEDKWNNKIADENAKNAKRSEIVGGFSTQMLNLKFGPSSVEERTAKATETTASAIGETNRYLKRNISTQAKAKETYGD